MDELMYSIIIPTLNEEHFLPKLLESLAAQTKKNFEAVVVDGSSRDQTITKAKAFEKKLRNFRLIISKKASLPLQRNIGARVAKTDWFIFVDADSVLLPHFIERIEVFIREHKPQLFTTWFRPDSEVSGDALLTLLANISTESSIIFKRPHAPGPLTIVSREAYEKVGGYDESLKWLEDYNFSSRVCEQGFRLQILRETLCVWSLRRWRKQGTLKAAQTYAKGVLQVLLRRTSKEMSGYIMGGHLYNKDKKPIKQFTLRKYEQRLKKLMKELFA